MSKLRKSLAGALVCVAAAVAAVPSYARAAAPPVDYKGQWWTHPAGCEYSRAGRPGETVWFLIINTARPGCPTYIASRTWGGVYKAQGPRVGQ